MKFVLFGLFLINTLASYSQEKKDSKIIVRVSDTSNLFTRLSMAIIDKGYSFENRDQSLGFISTAEHPVKNTAGSLKIRAIIKDTAIVFTGLFALDFEQNILGVKLERTFEPVTFLGEKNGSYKVCWREMESIAKQFGTKITYSK